MSILILIQGVVKPNSKTCCEKAIYESWEDYSVSYILVNASLTTRISGRVDRVVKEGRCE